VHTPPRHSLRLAAATAPVSHGLSLFGAAPPEIGPFGARAGNLRPMLVFVVAAVCGLVTYDVIDYLNRPRST
jgi:hypothetical protein